MAKGSRKRFNKSGRDQTVATVVTANNTILGKNSDFRFSAVFFRISAVFLVFGRFFRFSAGFYVFWPIISVFGHFSVFGRLLEFRPI